MFRRTILDRLALAVIAALLANSSVDSRTRWQGARKPEWSAFGASVAAASGFLFVAAQSEKNVQRGSGTVHVFQRRDSAWTHAGELAAPEATVEDEFGVSMTADENILVVGAQFADVHGKDSGLAYVFERRGETWHQAAVLSAADAAPDDQFGLTVSVSGETIAVGARLVDDRARDAGATYVFQRRGGKWQQAAKLTASDAVHGDLFGRVSIDKDLMVVSADLNDDRGNAAGKAYAFEKRGGLWTEVASFTASDAAAGYEFGISLTLKDGVSVFGAIGVEKGAGAAYVFEERGGQWKQAARLTPGDESRLFGFAVNALADLVVVGAPGDRKAIGAAYVFERRAGVWTQTAKLRASDEAPARLFGSSVAATENTIVVGALTNGGGTHPGAAYVFERTRNGTWSEVARLVRP